MLLASTWRSAFPPFSWSGWESIFFCRSGPSWEFWILET